MSESIELTEAFLAKIAGWDVMKQARALVERCEVVDCKWSPPLLTGIVREGELSHKAGLSIKGSIDIDNLCTCRASRQRGIICVHSVTVGLHQIHGGSGPRQPPTPPKRNLVEALRPPLRRNPPHETPANDYCARNPIRPANRSRFRLSFLPTS